MPEFLNESFTYTAGDNLSAHGWTPHTGGGGNALVSNEGRAYSESGLAIYYKGTPAGPRQSITFDVTSKSEDGTTGVYGRLLSASRTGYFVALNSGTWTLYYDNAAELNALATASDSLAVGATASYRFDIGGVKRLSKWNGSAWVELLKSPHDNHQGTGSAGVWLFQAMSNTTGRHIDNIVGTDGVTVEKRIVFDGNSLTAGTGTSAPSKTYPIVTCDLLGGDWHAINLGVAGQTTAQMSSDAASQVDPLYDAVGNSRNVLVAWEISNHLYFGTSAGDAYAAYVSYCQARRAAGFQVIAVTVLPRSDASTPGGFEAARQTVNASIRANWATFADGLADVAADTRIGDAGDELDTTYYGADKVHMTDAGYAVVAGIVAAAVTTLPTVASPADFAATAPNPGSNSLVLTWDEDANHAGWKLQMDAGAFVDITSGVTIAGGVCTYTISETFAGVDLENDTEYTFNLKAFDAEDVESAVATTTGTPEDLSPPTIAPILAGNPTVGADGVTVTIEFSEALAAAGMEASEWVLTVGGTALAAVSPSGTGTTWTLTAPATITFGQTVTLALSSGTILDAAGNEFDPEASYTVTNNSTQAGGTLRGRGRGFSGRLRGRR